MRKEREMKMKKIIALMLTLIVALFLASCGAQSDDTGNDSSKAVKESKEEPAGSDIKVKDMTVTAPSGWEVEHEGDFVGITCPDDPRIIFVFGSFEASGDLLPEDFINKDPDIPEDAAKSSTADGYGGYSASWLDEDEGVLIHKIVYKKDGVGYLIKAHCDEDKSGENVDGIIKSIRFE